MCLRWRKRRRHEPRAYGWAVRLTTIRCVVAKGQRMWLRGNATED